MVEVTIYFHHGGEWLTSLEPHYDRGCVTYWKGYDPDLISFDLVNEYINKLGFVGVQELIVLAPTGKYFEIIDDEGVRTLTSFISTEYKSIHLFATEDCELSIDVTDIVMHDGLFLLSPIVNKGTDYSESEDDNHIECGTTYDNSLVDYSTITLYFKDKLQSDPKYKVKEMKADLYRVFELNGLLEAVRTVLPKAHQRYCARLIEANWCKRWGKGELKKLLWWAAWSSFTKEFEDQLQEIKEVNEEVVDNNFTESFNAWIFKARYKPIIEMLEDIRVKIMERLAAKEVVVRKWKDDGFSPKSELLFIEYLKISKVCKVSGNEDNGYEVIEGTDRHIVNLREKKCTRRTWDLTEIPCPHAIKAMEHKKMIPKKEIHWYYSKEAALAVYKHKLQPVRGEPF
ncbi:hypothetical protein RDI58_014535 [Solanum bulbocastanum]|uniref:Zinc finger PMZ-type domain-containing protein n=1 Tax=Solanum bulbocastanum TaxID=147425 RepID=A0AAN8YAN2_SOLBU